MHKVLKYTSIFFLFAGAPLAVTAQKTFVEGTIEYNATLQPSSADAAAMGIHSGRYIITVKGKQVKKEFRLDNSFDNTIILNGENNTAYSLKITQGKKYAIQLDINELLAHDSKYIGFNLQDQGEDQAIAKMPVHKAKVTYKDGSSIPILYTKDLVPADEHLFEHFPAINGLPLDFTYQTENGAQIHFHADKIAPGVIENSTFRIPKDYKIISTTEYQELSKK